MFGSGVIAGSPSRGDLVFRCVIAIVLLAGAQWVGAAAAKPAGTVTILQGQTTVIRGLSQFDAAEGMHLLAGDLVRTGKEALLRIEYEDETSIAAGPDTVLQLNHPAARRANRPGLYLLEGWLKISSGKTDPAGKPAAATLAMDVVDITGVVVMHCANGSLEMFTQEGTARWIDRNPHGAQPVTLKQGDFLTAGPDKPPKVEPRPAAQFANSMPRSYRDTLPLRYALFKSRNVLPKGAVPFAYPDVEMWLNAEPTVRRQFVVLWRRKADNEAFRAALDHDLSKHPEWDPVLHPEKYEPPASATLNTPSTPPAPPATGAPIPKNP